MIPAVLITPVGEYLARWTGLLAIAWLADGLLRKRHARWRLVLWRSVLVLGVLLPAARLLPVGLVAIPIVTTAPTGTITPTSANGVALAPPFTSAPLLSPVAGPTLRLGVLVHPAARDVSLLALFPLLWAIGFGVGAVRLTALHLRLRRLVATTTPAGEAVLLLAHEVQARLRVKGSMRIRISDSAQSPFVCGLGQPVIVLPARVLRGMGDAELSGLLGHEIAHVRSRDLFWCIAWRWMAAACWFHPLVWKIHQAHQLACEQEADRVASAQWNGRGSYGQWLARLVLQIHHVPAFETTLTLNAGSQIAQRLVHLTRAGVRFWKWTHSLAAVGLSAILAFFAIGWNITEAKTDGAKPGLTASPNAITHPTAFRDARLQILDEGGQPIIGATLKAVGFRVKIPQLHSSAYSWRESTLGPAPSVTTDHDGRARVTYPFYGVPEEKLELSDITFLVSHSAFTPAQIDFAVATGDTVPLTLTRGLEVEISGYFGNNHQPVTELVPYLSPGTGNATSAGEKWEARPTGTMVSRQVSPGSHLLQLMGRLPSGQIVYSDTTEITLEPGKPYRINLELKPGIRVEGRLDVHVPRPVKNGRIIIGVRPKQVPYPRNYPVPDDFHAKFGYVSFWASYRPVSDDGTFVFESLPPGDVEVVACGDGFVSKNGDVRSDRGFIIPQSFPLTAPRIEITVATEPTSTLIVTAKAPDGAPISGATVATAPNMFHSCGTSILGNTYRSDEEPFHTIAPLPSPTWSALTNKKGVARIRNLPTSMACAFEIEHPDWELPIGSGQRTMSMQLRDGAETAIAITLQPKGNEFQGNLALP